MNRKPDKAFILAAGKGTRLRPYTDKMPKPMVDIAGTSIIKRTLSKLRDENVTETVVNLHHLGDVLENHLKDISAPRITLSKETDLLETGGGIKNALHHFGDDPFYIINGDALWDEKGEPALARLAAAWNEEKMDILLLLQPISNMPLTGAVGDYDMDADGKAIRSKNKTGQYMFAGIRIAHPRIFENTPDGAFSFLSLMDKAEEQGRLYAVPHTGHWYHISTPEDLESVNKAFAVKGDS